MSDPDSLPSGWGDYNLGDCGTWYGGSTPSKSIARFWQCGTVPWISPKDMKSFRINKSEDSVSTAALNETNLKTVPPGAVLMVVRSGILARTLPVSVSEVEATINQDLKGVLPHAWIDAVYLAYYLTCNEASILNTCGRSGTTVPSIETERLMSVRIRVPPLAEQRRIVRRIELLTTELSAAADALARARTNLDRYRESVLQSAVTGALTAEWRKANAHIAPSHESVSLTKPPPLPNRWKSRSKDSMRGHSALAVGIVDDPLPKGWSWTPLVRIAGMESGHTPSRRHPEWWGGGIPWISLSDARRCNGGKISTTEESTNAEGLSNSAARLLPKGTVCISRTASVGYVVVMDRPMATSQDFVNWVPTDCVLSDWLRIVFTADRGALLRFGKGTVHKTIYFPEWMSMRIALPPIEEQRQSVAMVDRQLTSIKSVIESIDRQIVQTRTLRQSILKAAFEGRLVPQDPNDEPASALLDRIKAKSSAAESPKTKITKRRKAAAK